MRITHDPGIPRLAFGEFFGDLVSKVAFEGFVVREVRGRPENGVPRHTHESPHFCLIIRGEYETSTHNLKGRCGASALLFHPAGATHDDQFRTRNGSCLTVSLPAPALDALNEPRLERGSVMFDDAEIGFPGARMLLELRRPDQFSRLAIESLALEMISCFIARFQRLYGSPAWLARAREFAHHDAFQSIRVAEMAQAAGVHPVHLARVFRERLGLSPGEYLRKVRVRKAMEMMASSEGLATIAVRAGFCDQSELTKAFRREIGTTPAAYRRVLG